MYIVYVPSYLKTAHAQDSELGDVKFFLEKLVNTGFLDWSQPNYDVFSIRSNLLKMGKSNQPIMANSCLLTTKTAI